MDNPNNQNKITCRKCNGPHLTIKCGKENKPSVIQTSLEENKNQEEKSYGKDFSRNRNDTSNNRYDNNRSDNRNYNNRNENNRNYNRNDNNRYENNRYDRRPLHKVKMSCLPVDMTEDELLELLYEWGQVVKLRVLNYDESSTAYIEFREEEEANYLCEALHKTPFETIIISVERIYE